MEFYYYAELDSFINEMKQFMALKYLEVSLLSEEDQKSNWMNPRIQWRFGKKNPKTCSTQKISTGRGEERLEREERYIFTLFYLGATVTHITFSILGPFRFVPDPGKHEAREWTQSSQQLNAYSLISWLPFSSFSHELLL